MSLFQLTAVIILKNNTFSSELETGGYKERRCAKIMRNPFIMLTELSVEHPKRAFAAIMLSVVMLASGAMHLQFDNSEDGFFPDDPSVDLLNQVAVSYTHLTLPTILRV